MSEDSSAPLSSDLSSNNDSSQRTVVATASTYLASPTEPLPVKTEPRETEPTRIGASSDAMELSDDAAFQEEARAFEMSLDALSESNQHDHLYHDAPSFTSEAGPSTLSNQTDHDEATPTAPDPPHQAGQSDNSYSMNQEKATQSMVGANAPQTPSAADVHASQKSPRRATPQKTPPAKKNQSGNKRSNAAATPQSQAFSWNDILRVQNLIERCLQQHLSKNDIVTTLKAQAKVDPSFTAVVWQKLEEQNPAFFRAYALQLQLKEQITAFNYLVSQQKEMMAKASGNAAFLSFLSSSDSRAQQQQRQAMMRNSRLGATNLQGQRGGAGKMAPSSQTYNIGSSTFTSSSFVPPSPLPLPSPIKTDLDTHAFFS